MTRRFVRMLVLVALGAAAPDAAGDWTYAASDHFEVYTTGGDRQAREALAQYERVRAFFISYLKLAPNPRHPTRLIVFSGDREYAPYRPNEVATAFYQSGPTRDLIVMRSLATNDAPMVVHEYAHLIFRHSGAVFPLWLNEGLAEFFSTVAIENSSVTVGLVPLGRLLPLARGAALMSFDQLFAIDRRSPAYTTKAHAGLFYSQSWALTHMLLTDARYQPHSARFLDLMAGGAPAGPALEATFGRPLASIFRDLEAHVRRDRFQGIRQEYRPPRIDAIWTPRAASAFEAALVTANLLADRPDREDDARAAFEALAKERPDDLGLAESRAHFELGLGHTSEAMPFLERVVALGTRSASLYRAYAVRVVGSDVAKAEVLLSSAVALDPDDLTARLDLGALLVRERRAADALAALAGLTRVPEESQFVFFQIIANAQAQLGRLKEALTAAARVQEAARGADEIQHAAALKKSLEDFAAASAAVDQALRDRAAADRATPPPRAVTFAAPPLPLFAEGRITNITCGNPPILEVATAKGTVRLLIDDPLLIKVEGRATVTTDLTCGRQDTKARVGYEPAIDSVRKTVGKVRVLDFRE